MTLTSALRVSKQGARAVSALLRTSAVEELVLDNCRLGDAASGVVARAVRKPMALLNINRCDVGSIGAAALGGMLSRVSTLTELDVSWNSIRGSGAVAFSRGLQRNTGLKVHACGRHGTRQLLNLR